MKKSIKKRDLFGHQISLNFNGKQSHTTLIGGIFSVILNAFFVFFIITKVKVLVLREDDSLSQMGIITNMTESMEVDLIWSHQIGYWVDHQKKKTIGITDPDVKRYIDINYYIREVDWNLF